MCDFDSDSDYHYVEPIYSDNTIEHHAELIPQKPTLSDHSGHERSESYVYIPKPEHSLMSIYISTYGKTLDSKSPWSPQVTKKN